MFLECITFYTANDVCLHVSYVIFNKCKHVSLYEYVEIHTSANAYEIANGFKGESIYFENVFYVKRDAKLK